LLPNVALKCDGKALIDLVNGLFSGSVVLVDVADGDLANHDLFTQIWDLQVNILYRVITLVGNTLMTCQISRCILFDA
jgi:hypothetical protein